MDVALTFDAEHPDMPQCPEHNSEQIVELLADLHVRATFFLQGRWASAYPKIARRIASEGHLIGSHSHHHVPVDLLSESGLKADLLAAEQVIQEITGRDPRPWFRLPFGTGAKNFELLNRLAQLGYRHHHWNVKGDDWRHDQTGEAVESWMVRDALAKGHGSVLLLHSWAAPALGALPGIVTALRTSGARFVGLDELLDRGIDYASGGAHAHDLSLAADARVTADHRPKQVSNAPFLKGGT